VPWCVRDEIDDHVWQLDLFGHLYSGIDVVLDDQGAHAGFKFVVRVAAHLVLDEVLRFLHLADIVVKRTHTAEQGIGANAGRTCFGQVGHLEAVVECAGRFQHEPLEDGLVGVAEFQQGDIGGDAERLFNEQDQRIGKPDTHGVARRKSMLSK
jgi:hypothetical protein